MSASDAPAIAARTVGDLRARAGMIRQARERAMAEKVAAEKRQHEAEVECSRRARLDAVARRSESVWREIETEIERRGAAGNDTATCLLTDLESIAQEKGFPEDFIRRLREIRDRHARKAKLIERLAKLG
jgi:hypothetical protein